MIVTFCGHSQFIRTPQLEETFMRLLEERIGDESAEFFFGGYGGFDEFAYQCGKCYQKEHPNTKLIFVTPYMTESYQKNHLCYNKEKYDEIVYPEIEDKPKRFAILYRNQWMVESADLVVAYVKHTFGGAYQTYRYAQKLQKEIVNLSSIEVS